MTSGIVTRFAPSPTGLLHAGHAYSAMFGFEVARENGGRFLLRIEDIDFTRCRVEFEQAIYEDLQWLGLEWEVPVRRQSEHLSEYLAAAEQLRSRGLLYPCFCTRKDIQREIDAAGGAPHGLEGPLYPGICHSLSEDERQSRIAAGESCALRLDVDRAVAEVGDDLEWIDLERGVQRAEPQKLGDVVLVRKDIGCSYHLAVVVDDAIQEVTRVTRGEDLFEATHLQRLLQALLGLKTPEYQHHRLLCDTSGKRLAKRDEAETLRSFRHRGVSSAEVLKQLGFHMTGELGNDG
jgi:glutamyl-Q tRNA(Asp) synthetase